jgi:hypothetical protein
MAINIGGYLAAGLIGIVLYSMFTKKQGKPEEFTPAEPVVEFQPEKTGKVSLREETEPVRLQPGRKLEFIRLGEQVEPEIAPVTPLQKLIPDDDVILDRPDRKNVIMLAKKMMNSGATNSRIKQILPVSDAELALLSLNNK